VRVDQRAVMVER